MWTISGGDPEYSGQKEPKRSFHLNSDRYYRNLWHNGKHPGCHQSEPQPELDIKFPVISLANRLNQNIGLTAKGLRMFEALYMKISLIGQMNRDKLPAQGFNAQISRNC